MRSGRLSHIVKFYKKTVTRDEYGSSVESYPEEPTITTRGERIIRSGSKIESDSERFYSRSLELVVRYRDSITETMRVKIGDCDDVYQITFLQVEGRKQWLRLDLERLNM